MTVTALQLASLGGRAVKRTLRQPLPPLGGTVGIRRGSCDRRERALVRQKVAQSPQTARGPLEDWYAGRP